MSLAHHIAWRELTARLTAAAPRVDNQLHDEAVPLLYLVGGFLGAAARPSELHEALIIHRGQRAGNQLNTDALKALRTPCYAHCKPPASFWTTPSFLPSIRARAERLALPFRKGDVTILGPWGS